MIKPKSFHACNVALLRLNCLLDPDFFLLIGYSFLGFMLQSLTFAWKLAPESYNPLTGFETSAEVCLHSRD